MQIKQKKTQMKTKSIFFLDSARIILEQYSLQFQKA